MTVEGQKEPMNEHDELMQIRLLIQAYFEGLYEADVDKLRAIFDPQACLQAPGLRRSLDEWLAAVGSRPVPKNLGAQWAFEIIEIDLQQDLAMAKVYCPLFEFHYIDFLAFLKEKGQWRIVNKLYANQTNLN